MFAGDRFCGSCGAAVPQGVETELLADLEHVTLGEYEIQGVLGRGGMGLVYLAHDISLNRKVAIKVLPPSMLQGGASVERFRREARIAASLRHRHITSVFGLKETTKLVFFLMEYVDGRTLDGILRDAKRLEIAVAEAVIHDAASALSYAHRREVVHRDLKPANIIIDVEGMAMITDFGVAKLSSAQGLTATGSTVGSPAYMSPEQWSGQASGLSDQYALGCVAYELLAGRPPFQGETIGELMKQHLFDPPPPLSTHRPDCPPALAEGVMRMLEKDPSARWASLEEAMAAMGVRTARPDDPVRRALMALAKRGHDVRALPKTPTSPIPASRITVRRPLEAPPAPAPGPVRRPWRAWAALVLIAGVGVAAYVLSARRGLRAPISANGPTVPAIATLVIAGAPTTLGPGERVALKVQAKNAAGAPVSPGQVTWSTSDTAVARIAPDGTLTAVAAGTVTLTASSGGNSGSVTLTIRPAAPTVATLDVTPRTLTLAPGRTAQLTAVATDARGTPVTGGQVTWSSSNPAIVTVTANGVARGVAPGTATVSATGAGQSAAVAVTVASPSTPASLASLALAPARLRLVVRETAALTVTGRDAQGRPVAGRRVEWTSSNPGVATVTPGGVVAGVATGAARITATSGGVTSGPAEITVVAAAPPPPPAPAGPAPRGVLQLLLEPAPTWGFVSINGLARGQRTREVDTLPSGVAHKVHVERNGFVTVDTTVTLQPGETRLVRIVMTPTQ